MMRSGTLPDRAILPNRLPGGGSLYAPLGVNAVGAVGAAQAAAYPRGEFWQPGIYSRARIGIFRALSFAGVCPRPRQDGASPSFCMSPPSGVSSPTAGGVNAARLFQFSRLNAAQTPRAAFPIFTHFASSSPCIGSSPVSQTEKTTGGVQGVGHSTQGNGFSTRGGKP